MYLEHGGYNVKQRSKWRQIIKMALIPSYVGTAVMLPMWSASNMQQSTIINFHKQALKLLAFRRTKSETQNFISFPISWVICSIGVNKIKAFQTSLDNSLAARASQTEWCSASIPTLVQNYRHITTVAKVENYTSQFY